MPKMSKNHHPFSFWQLCTVALLSALTAILIPIGCQKDPTQLEITTEVSSLTATSAICGGEIKSDGGFAIKERGVCWSTSENPTINDEYCSEGEGTGRFMSVISGLDTNTTYYVRAYAINSAVTFYG